MTDFPQYTAAVKIDRAKRWKILCQDSGFIDSTCNKFVVGQAAQAAAYSRATSKQAHELIALACPLDRMSTYYIAEEIRDAEPELKGLARIAFSRRLDRCRQYLEANS